MFVVRLYLIPCLDVNWQVYKRPSVSHALSPGNVLFVLPGCAFFCVCVCVWKENCIGAPERLCDTSVPRKSISSDLFASLLSRWPARHATRTPHLTKLCSLLLHFRQRAIRQSRLRERRDVVAHTRQSRCYLISAEEPSASSREQRGLAAEAEERLRKGLLAAEKLSGSPAPLPSGTMLPCCAERQLAATSVKSIPLHN